MFTAYLFEKSTVFIAGFNYLDPENITWPVGLWLSKIFLESRGIPLAGHPKLLERISTFSIHTVFPC